MRRCVGCRDSLPSGRFGGNSALCRDCRTELAQVVRTEEVALSSTRCLAVRRYRDRIMVASAERVDGSSDLLAGASVVVPVRRVAALCRALRRLAKEDG